MLWMDLGKGFGEGMCVGGLVGYWGWGKEGWDSSEVGMGWVWGVVYIRLLIQLNVGS